MPTAANGSGSANDAAVATGPASSTRTPAEQEYLDTVADQAADAVKVVKRMIADLEKSLKVREAEAKTARAHAQGKSKE